MKHLLICTMALFFSSALAKHHHKEPPCNHESLGEAWGENT